MIRTTIPPLAHLLAVAQAAADMSSSCRAEPDDFEFIAAASPHAAIALLERIHALEAGLVRACGIAEGALDRADAVRGHAEIAALRALAEGKP